MGSACARCCHRRKSSEAVEQARSAEDEEACVEASAALGQSHELERIVSTEAEKSSLFVRASGEDQKLDDDDYDDEDSDEQENGIGEVMDGIAKLEFVYLGARRVPQPEDLQRRYILYSGSASGTEQTRAERLRLMCKSADLAQQIVVDLTLARTGKALPASGQHVDNDAVKFSLNGELRVTMGMLHWLRALVDNSGWPGPVKLCKNLCEVARLAWSSQARVTDGFVAVPGSVFSTKDPSTGRQREYGCLVYYTPRTRDFEVDCLPRMLLHFLLNGGGPGNFIYSESAKDGSSAEEAVYFPCEISGELYTHIENAVFQQSAKSFLSMLMSKDCNRVGIHMDMVLCDSVHSGNLLCVVLIFAPRQ